MKCHERPGGIKKASIMALATCHSPRPSAWSSNEAIPPRAEPAPRVTGVALLGFVLLLTAALGPNHAEAHDNNGLTAEQLEQVGFDQRLGNDLPLDANFLDDTGSEVSLKTYFGRHPVLLVPVYYHCRTLCSVVLKNFSLAVQRLPFKAGQDFEIIVFSFDPRDTPAVAAEIKKKTMAEYHSPATEVAGWHFLTGSNSAIDELARAIGFRYVFDPSTGEYAHASGIVLATAAGQITRYFYGIDYPIRDLRLGLIESATNKIGSAVDQILLRCFRYDPVTGKYTLIIERVLSIAAGITFFVLAMMIGGFLYAERLRRIRRVGLNQAGHISQAENS